MLWYPVKAYSDFRVKLQFREGRTDGGYSNGGVFVRFPDPQQDPRTDECAKRAGDRRRVGRDLLRPRDPALGRRRPSRRRRARSTTSSPSTRAATSKKGEWEDYEIEVVGQKFTIRRNGEVINEFENTPGQESSRAGDPSTTLRQFAQGYIGLQNHSDADRCSTATSASRTCRRAPGPRGAEAVHGLRQGPAHDRGPLDRRGRPCRAQADAGVRDRRAGLPEGPTQTVPLVPQAPVSPIIPPMTQPTATAKLGTLPSKITRATFAKKGVAVPIACTGAMDGSAKLTVASSVAKQLKLSRTTLASSDAKCWGPHSIKVSLKPSSSLARRRPQGRPKSVKLTLNVQMRVFGKAPQTLTKSITLKR